MTPESIPDAWLAAFERAEELDPIICEALRPVVERLSKDAPNQASAMTLAMICRALRMIELPPGEKSITREQMQMDLAQFRAAYVIIRPDHP